MVKHFEAMQKKREKVAVQQICEDGSWGPMWASSNKPELVVVVVEAEQRMHDMFEAMNVVLRTHPEVGEYNQKI